jgi:GNAT superfamily N-acetyltransferase
MIKPIDKPVIKLDIFDCNGRKLDVWEGFKAHHYLTGGLNKSSRCFMACWNDAPVGFYAVLPMPCGSIKNAWRGHRLVVISDYQGLGIGNRLSEWVAELLTSEGKRFFAKTANVKLGRYRDKSDRWRGTSKNGRVRKATELSGNYNNLINKDLLEKRVCFSHEYVGGQ